MNGLLRKDQLERSLHDEAKLIEQGILREDNPLDCSEEFQRLCGACRRGDLKVCQEMIQQGANINGKDQYDYTPLILASLCGHYEVVQLLLESGALCERDTFQGERCLYNALNDRIRHLLLQYDYSKSTDPLQPLASHLTSLLTREQTKTSDITIVTPRETFHLHKFVLSARSPYFDSKLSAAPDTKSWKLPSTIPSQSFSLALRHLYLGEIPREFGGGPGTGFTDSDILAGVDRISKHLEIQNLSQLILDSSDRRLARQRRQDEVERGRDQLDLWFHNHVLRHAVETDTSRAEIVRWDRDNDIFADILLRADEDEVEEHHDLGSRLENTSAEPVETSTRELGIPLDSDTARTAHSPTRQSKPRHTKIFPCHKAMLIRSEFFLTMFESPFRESKESQHLQIVSIDCSPDVLEIILTFLYTEKADFGLDIAVDVLFAADMLFLEKLKTKAALVIYTLGNGTATAIPTETNSPPVDEDLDIYEILRAAWLTRVQRLEEFAARYIAYRLESYIDDPDFADLVKESAGRISARQETDSIELLDDIRFYLSERFRLRFEDSGLDEIMDEDHVNLYPASTHLDVTQPPLVTTSAGAPSPPTPPLAEKVSREPPTPQPSILDDEGVDMSSPAGPFQPGFVRTLDGELAGDEFAADSINYQILLGKIDTLLEHLKLDA